MLIAFGKCRIRLNNRKKRRNNNKLILIENDSKANQIFACNKLSHYLLFVNIEII